MFARWLKNKKIGIGVVISGYLRNRQDPSWASELFRRQDELLRYLESHIDLMTREEKLRLYAFLLGFGRRKIDRFFRHRLDTEADRECAWFVRRWLEFCDKKQGSEPAS